MFKRAFEDGVKVKVAAHSVYKSLRGQNAVIRNGIDIHGTVEIEFGTFPFSWSDSKKVVIGAEELEVLK